MKTRSQTKLECTRASPKPDSIASKVVKASVTKPTRKTPATSKSPVACRTRAGLKKRAALEKAAAGNPKKKTTAAGNSKKKTAAAGNCKTKTAPAVASIRRRFRPAAIPTDRITRGMSSATKSAPLTAHRSRFDTIPI